MRVQLSIPSLRSSRAAAHGLLAAVAVVLVRLPPPVFTAWLAQAMPSDVVLLLRCIHNTCCCWWCGCLFVCTTVCVHVFCLCCCVICRTPLPGSRWCVIEPQSVRMTALLAAVNALQSILKERATRAAVTVAAPPPHPLLLLLRHPLLLRVLVLLRVQRRKCCTLFGWLLVVGSITEADTLLCVCVHVLCVCIFISESKVTAGDGVLNEAVEAVVRVLNICRTLPVPYFELSLH